MNPVYRTPAEAPAAVELSARECLPRWQEDPTPAEIKLFDKLTVAFMRGRSGWAIDGNAVPDRGRMAADTADFVVAKRRELLGKR